MLPHLLLLSLVLSVLSLSLAAGGDVCIVGVFVVSSDGVKVRGAAGEGRTAFRLGVKYVNERGLLPPGWVMRSTDYAVTDPTQALESTINTAKTPQCVSGTGALLPTLGIVGMPFSSMAIISGAAATIYKIPQVSPSATSVTLSDKNVYPYVFRTGPVDDLAARAIIKVISAFNWRRVCVIATADDYGEKAARTVRTAAFSSNITVDTVALFAIPNGVGYADTTKVMEDLKPLTPIRDLSGQLLGDRCFINIVLTNGVLQQVTSALGRMNRTGPDYMYIHADSSTNQWISPAFRAGFNNSGPLTTYARNWMGVVPNAGDPDVWPMRAEINKYWKANTDSSSSFLNNTYYDDGDGIPTTSATVYTFDAVLTYADALTRYIGKNGTGALLDELKVSNITGASGVVNFDKNGDRQGAFFSLFSFSFNETLNTTVLKKVGSISDARDLVVDMASVVWPSGKVGFDGRPLDYTLVNLSIPTPAKVGFTVVSAVLIGLCALGSLLIHAKRHVAVIRRSSPLFNHLICFGAALAFAVPIAYSHVNPAACAVRPWLHSLSFTFVFGSLFTKTWRIAAIFDVTSAKPSVEGLRDVDLFRILGALALLDVVILVTWTLGWRFTSLEWVDELPGKITTGHTCGGPRTEVFVGIIVATKVAVILWGLWLAIRVKTLVRMKDLNDSKPIFYSIFVIGAWSLVIITVVALIGVRADATYYLVCVSHAICFLTVISILIAPKLIDVYIRGIQTRGEVSSGSMAIVRGSSNLHSREMTATHTSDKVKFLEAENARLSALVARYEGAKVEPAAPAPDKPPKDDEAATLFL